MLIINFGIAYLVKVLFASAEIVPFASTGGLGDVCAALPKALAKKGISVFRIMPLYRSIDRGRYRLKLVDTVLDIPLGSSCFQARVFEQTFENVTTYFIHCPEFFDRDGLYGDDFQAFNDNYERFLFFQKAVVALLDQFSMKVDVVHCNDWHTGLIPFFLRYGINGLPRFGKEKTVFTIHNLAHQGWAHAEKFYLTQLPTSLYHWKALEFYGELNCLKGGLVASDAVTTVSPSYAKEILTPELGNQLDGVLLERVGSLFGILNGVDYSRWNPKTDPHLAASYSYDDLNGKSICKKVIQQQFGLPEEPKKPLFGMISRLTHQKGLDLLNACIESLMELDAQWIFLGTGESEYENMAASWAKHWPDRVATSIAYSSEQAHQIFAGADFFLMPSIFEPCGQSQIYSMQYGTVPIGHKVGGLADTIRPYPKKNSSGFLFSPFTTEAFCNTLSDAIEVYHQPRRWTPFVKRVMRVDFSVSKMAEEYINVYERIVEKMA